MNTELLHNQVWTRFIRMPYGHLLDYADQSGHTVIPTAADLQASLPNPLAWGVSIENGAFFTGLYLYGLSEKYECAPEEQLKKEILILANGLFLLCDVCKTDGCIARGVAEDGVSHPPFSSEDQLGPWLLGLWRLLHSPASDQALRNEIRKRLIRTLVGIRAVNWAIPTEWEGVMRGSYAHKDWRGVAKLMFSAAVAREIGVIGNTEFEAIATQRPDDSLYNRVEIIAQGFTPDMIHNPFLIQFWIHICAQLCVCSLLTLDPPRAHYYRKGLATNGAAVVSFLKDYEKYIDVAGNTLCYDWRPLLADVRPWKNAKEAVAEADRQLHIFFQQISPGMHDEKQLLGHALSGAWIAVVSGDEKASRYAYQCLGDASRRVNWEGCGYCFAFMAEAAIYCYQNLVTA